MITPDGWPSPFDIDGATVLADLTLESHGDQPGIRCLVVELRWAIAQLKAERAASAERDESEAKEWP